MVALALAPPSLLKAADLDEKIVAAFEKVKVTLNINGIKQKLNIEPRVTWMDLLPEQLNLTITKKGCDNGRCGACTVHVDGEQMVSYLTFAIMQDGIKITTIEGLGNGNKLHPMQEAFIKHDGLHCGYYTPGQIMAAVACIRKGHADTEAEIR